jgi:hypothetical protein
MSDAFSGHTSGLNSPASGVEAVTPSDTVPLTKTSRGLWVGGGGNVSVVMADGTTAVLAAVPSGTLLPLRVTRVNLASTTATLIVALN